MEEGEYLVLTKKLCMETDLYKAVEIKSLEQLKKNKNIKSVTELKKDGVVLAKLWFYGKTCYFLPFRTKGKEMVEKYIKSLNNKLIINRKKREAAEKRRMERELNRNEREKNYKTFYENPGIVINDGSVFFSTKSMFSTSLFEEVEFGVDLSGGWSESYRFFFTVEQYFEWIKSVVFKDYYSQDLLEVSDPFNCYHISAKKSVCVGHSVKNYNDEIWKKIREDIMIGILLRRCGPLYSKRNPDYKDWWNPEYNNLHFVNAASKDRIWGIGYCWKDAMKNKEDWGDNLLGKCYDKVRDILMNRESNPQQYYYYLKPVMTNDIFVLDNQIIECEDDGSQIVFDHSSSGYTYWVQGTRVIKLEPTPEIVEVLYDLNTKQWVEIHHPL